MLRTMPEGPGESPTFWHGLAGTTMVERVDPEPIVVPDGRATRAVADHEVRRCVVRTCVGCVWPSIR